MATNNYIYTHNYKRMMTEIASKTSHIEELQKQIGKIKQLAKKAEAYDILAEEAQLENSIGEISIIGEFNKGINAESLTGLLLDNKQTSKQILVKSLELKVVETQEVEEQQTQETGNGEQQGDETQQGDEQTQTGDEEQTGEQTQPTEEAKKLVQVKYSATITLSTEQKVLDKNGKVVGVIPATFELGNTELSTLTADKINYLGDITLFGEKQQTQQTTGNEQQTGEGQQQGEQQQTGDETQTATGLTFTSPTYSDSAEASEPKTTTFTQTTANVKTYSTSPSFGELTQTSVSGTISLKTLYVDSTPVVLPVLTLTADMLKATPIVGKVEEA